MELCEFELPIENEYHFFYNGPLSQWFTSKFEWNGWTYHNCEQFMMYQKAVIFNDVEIAVKILNETNPKTCKALGRLVRNFDEDLWKKVRFDVVFLGNCLKFTQNPELKKYLIETGNTTIVEASPYDRIWGIGMSKEDPDRFDQNKWKGLNLLGDVLVSVRSFCKNEDSTSKTLSYLRNIDASIKNCT